MTAADSAAVATPGWNPVLEERADIVSESAAGAVHDLLDRDGERPATGSPLPLLWHWLAFLPQARHSDLGSDGHPATGAFLPPHRDRHACTAVGISRVNAHYASANGSPDVQP